MRKLTKIFAPALIAATVVSVAAPASAQQYGNNNNHYGHYDRNDRDSRQNSQAIRAQIQDLQARINRNDNRDRISEREAASLRRDIRELEMRFRAYNRDGLSRTEYRWLQDRIQNLRGRLQFERHDRDGRRW